MAPRSPGLPAPLQARRTADRAVRSVRRTKVKLSSLDASVGFPLPAADRPPRASSCPRRSRRSAPTTTPSGPARRPARVARVDHHQRPAAAGRAGAGRRRRSAGVDRLADLRALDTSTQGDSPPAVIFTPNHHSHLDTAARHHGHPRAVAAGTSSSAAAADYFFDNRAEGAPRRRSSLNAFPIERTQGEPAAVGRPGRRAASTTAGAWSSSPRAAARPDGWGQPFKGGAAYLSHPDRRARRARVHRGHRRASSRKGMKRPASPARPRSRSARRCGPADGREHPPLQRPHRGRPSPPSADEALHRLVVGPPAGRPPGQPAR